MAHITKKTPARKPRPSGAARDAGAERTAMRRAQLILELTPAATIITANDALLAAMGYTLRDLTGKPHSILVDPGSRGGVQESLWQRLAAGEPVADTFALVDQAGRPVWLHGSYNPLLSAKGAVYKIVAYLTDVTAQRIRAWDFESQIEAVSRARSVIEYSLEGIVQSANSNFLNIMGYTLEDIRGKNHTLFVDSDERESPAYRRFWDTLRAGEPVSGHFRRIGNGGREVWLQANYNPVLDPSGRPFKIVNFATDITALRQQGVLNQAFKGALDNLKSSVMVADSDHNIIYMNANVRTLLSEAQADIRTQLPGFDVSHLIGQNIDVFHKVPSHQRGMLARLEKGTVLNLTIGGRAFMCLANPMLDPSGKRLGTVVEWHDQTRKLAIERDVQIVVSAVADGNFEVRIPVDGKSGFMSAVSEGVNRMSDNMAHIVSRVQAAVAEVSQGVDRIAEGNADLSQRTEAQTANLVETASSMDEMTSTVRQNADNSALADKLAGVARDEANKGGVVVNEAVRAMADINASSRRIADIVGVIDEIAFQTNLLALNAAVEAARAGEQGRGFAVVAGEVRNLAGRSATAAKEIKGLIQDSVKKVDDGSRLVSQSGETLERIVGAVKKVSDIIGEIAFASKEQSVGIQQVNQAVMKLDEMTQQNASLVEEVSAVSRAVAEQTADLSAMLARCTVSSEVAQEALQDRSRASAQAAAPAPRAAQRTGSEPNRRSATRPWATRARAAPPAGVAPVTCAAVEGTLPVMAKKATGTDAEWDEF